MRSLQTPLSILMSASFACGRREQEMLEEVLLTADATADTTARMHFKALNSERPFWDGT